MSNLRPSENVAFAGKFDFEARVEAEVERRYAASPAMQHCVNEAGHLLAVSDAWLSKLGYTRDEVLGHRFTDFLTPESEDRAIGEVAPEFARTGRSENVHYKMVKKNGDVIDVLMSAVRGEDIFGQGRTSLAVVTDVTALIEASRQLAEARSQLHELSVRDELTGLADRRAFDEALTGEYQRARRDDMSIAVLMVDIDRLTAFNDLYGRQAGDNCLKLIAAAIAKIVRKGDMAARYGDDAIAVILPSAQEAGALSVAARIQQAVLRLAIEHMANEPKIATVSMGVATTWPATATEVQESLVQEAQRALRQAKLRGRNAVMSASSPDVATIASVAA